MDKHRQKTAEVLTTQTQHRIRNERNRKQVKAGHGQISVNRWAVEITTFEDLLSVKKSLVKPRPGFTRDIIAENIFDLEVVTRSFLQTIGGTRCREKVFRVGHVFFRSFGY